MASLAQLSALYARVRTSPHSDFYRTFYGDSAPTEIASQAAWESLPLLSKSDIARVPYHNRIFIDPHSVDIIRLTSGTSAAGVLAIPRARMPYTTAEERLMPVDRYMGFLVPHRVYDNYAKPSSQFVGGDPARLDASAALAAAVQIEGIGALPSTLIAFAAPLAARYNITKIRHLCFNGDICTASQREALRTLYPGVTTTVSSYGSSETQGLCAISYAYPGHEYALRGHPLVHYEIIDEAGTATDMPGSEGELVVSIIYEHAAFPLVRYRTGDRVQLIERGTDGTYFIVRGRTISERVRFATGTILLAELERAIAAVSKDAVIDFEAVVGETGGAANRMLTLDLTLIVPPHHAQLAPTDFARALEHELRVAEHRTYGEAIAQGICAPINCTVAGLDHGLSRKRRRLVDGRSH